MYTLAHLWGVQVVMLGSYMVGAALAIALGPFIMNDTSILFCESLFGSKENMGGAVALNQADSMFGNCSFMNCVSEVNGGSIGVSVYNHNNEMTLEHCIFASNIAHGVGGAIYLNNDNLSCTSCSFFHNVAAKGGALSTNLSSLSDNKFIMFTDCTFIGNINNESKDTSAQCIFSSFSSGGALMLHVRSGDTVSFSGCVFGGNKNLNLWCKGCFPFVIMFSYNYSYFFFTFDEFCFLIHILFQIVVMILVLKIIQQLLSINHAPIQTNIGYE
jgi:hypothetical protein